ncbi:MAG TPA: tyrosine-type recombinase/integrase [Euzebyales bacterium]|nr:tyrosine-type recombinase/integrase [Euzebyales bacterium]
MAAERKADKTRAVYRMGVEQFLDWCHTEGVKPALEPDTVAAFTNHLLDAGRAPATARLRQLAVRRFSAWLADEDEIDHDLLVKVKPPKLDTAVVDELTDDQLRALIKACAGKSLSCKRDEAIVRFMCETGARAGEVINMTVHDVDLSRGLAVIRRGKGGKGRHVPFGPATGAAIDRYMRARRKHIKADGPTLWLGERGYGFTYAALWRSLRIRARKAGLGDVHPHVLRHTFAGRWLDAGGTEQGLMVTAGWSRRDMIDRYSRATSERRAADEARRLGLGDL